MNLTGISLLAQEIRRRSLQLPAAKEHRNMEIAAADISALVESTVFANIANENRGEVPRRNRLLLRMTLPHDWSVIQPMSVVITSLNLDLRR